MELLSPITAVDNLAVSLGIATVFPHIRDAVSDKVELFFDGGIRRGEDIVKAHALGATAACSGRCWFWGLAANGEQGVTDVLEILNQETSRHIIAHWRTQTERCWRT